MTRREATSAASQNLSSAVQTVAVAARAAGLIAPVATVLYAVADEPYTVEVGGHVFTRPADVEEARRAVEIKQLGDRIEQLASDGAATSRLLGELEQLWADRAIVGRDYMLRQVGYALIENGQGELWRLIYARLGADNDTYRPGAAAKFLDVVGADVTRGSGW